MAKTGRKAGGGLARPVQPSPELAAITGSDPLPRSQVVSKVWDHIRKNNLQNPQNKREILADDKLQEGLRQGPLQHVRDEQASVEPSEISRPKGLAEEGIRSGGSPFSCPAKRESPRRIDQPRQRPSSFSRVTG